MMQRDARSADFIDQALATRLQFIEIGRPEGIVGRPRKDQVGDLKVAHRTVVRRSQIVDFLGDPQRCFADFIVRSSVTDNCRIYLFPENHHRIIANPWPILGASENAWDDYVRVRCPNEVAEFFQRTDLVADLFDSCHEVAFPLRRDGFLSGFVFVSL